MNVDNNDRVSQHLFSSPLPLASKTAATVVPSRPHQQQQQQHTMDKENHTHRPQTPVKLLPPGSSKLLRKHFSSQQRRKHLQSGPIRVTTQSGGVRLGYDGTYETPSKELLQSTTCSRRQRIRPDDSSPLNIVLQPQQEAVYGGERQDCINPVAWTLWNADEEPMERDVCCSSPAAVRTQPPACVARPLPTRPQQQQNVMMMLS